jgi:hypothetical protein
VIGFPGTPFAGATFVIVAVLTLNDTALDDIPFCCTKASPDLAIGDTLATISVSVQLTTAAGLVPSQTIPLPCVDPKPEPVTVTCVPAIPVAGDTLEIVAVFTVKGIAFDEFPSLCMTSTTPDWDMGATIATI